MELPYVSLSAVLGPSFCTSYRIDWRRYRRQRAHWTLLILFNCLVLWPVVADTISALVVSCTCVPPFR